MIRKMSNVLHKSVFQNAEGYLSPQLYPLALSVALL